MAYLRRMAIVLIAVLLTGTLSVVAQDATPEANDAEETGDFIIDSGIISVTYPLGWLAYTSESPGGSLYLWLHNTQSASDGFLSSTDIFEPNDVTIFINLVRKSDLLFRPANYDQAQELDMLSLLRLYRLPAFSNKYAEYSETIMKGKAAAQVWFRMPDYVDGYGLMFELDRDFIAIVSLYTFPDNLADWTSIALAVAESITYHGKVEATPEAVEATPLPLTENYITENSMFGIDYPAGLTFETFDPPSSGDWILSANIRSGDALTAEQIFPAGRVSIDVTVTDIENFVQSVQREPSEITAEDIVRFRWFGLSADQADRVDDLIQTPAANGSFERGDIQPLTLGEHEAARVDMRLPRFNEGFALAYIDNDIVVEIRLITAPGELDQWTATALAIAESFGYFG